jgi:diguanylate cyclase (GGDEF)-like protein
LPAAPPPTADDDIDAGVIRHPRPASSRRLQQHLSEQDTKGERAIAVAQAYMALFLFGLHAIGFSRGFTDADPFVLVALAGLICSSAVRWWLAGQRPLRERALDLLSVVDVGIVLSLIWSYQYVFHHPAGGVLKAPAFYLLLLLIGVRALRFHPRPVIVAGIAALFGWLTLVCAALLTDGLQAITADYRTYLESFHIFPPAEVMRIVALLTLVAVLAGGAYGARRTLSRAAHVIDYSEALEAARKHLEESSLARARAESAIAALDRRDAELSEQNKLFNAALSNMPQGLCMFDENQKLLVCNDRYIEMYGLSKDHARRGTPFRRILESRIERGIFDGTDAEAYLEERLASVSDKVRHTKVHEMRDGRIVAITHEPLEGGGWVATHDDVTYLHRIEARLSYLARHDALTDLPNRSQLREHLDDRLKEDGAAQSYIILLLFEIDRFKEINDTFGPSVGDGLLQGVAQRLRRRLEGADMIARVGGDEFVILHAAEDPPVAADALAKRVHSVLGRSFDVDGHCVSITVSIGIAVAPVDGRDSDTLLKNADLALVRAKRDGFGNSRYFERGMDERMRARHKLEYDMRTALRDDQFELYYQPQIDLDGNRVVGFEALLRWNHPEHGIIAPGDFVSLAEESGLIVQLGDWALRRACEQAASWPKGIRVAVNLSVAQFRSGHVRQSVIAALGAATLSPSRLELEITESVLMDDMHDVAGVLKKLQEIGVGIALDDFGTGFSSLSYLTRMRFDKIKIDKHFIQGMQGEQSSALAVLRSVVALSKSLGIATLAEGIETGEQLERVRAEGCTEAQGYYIGRPMDARQVATLLGLETAGDKTKRAN